MNSETHNPSPKDTKTCLTIQHRIRIIRERKAKMDYSRNLATRLNNASITLNAKEIHNIFKATSQGDEVNHKIKCTISIRLPNGKTRYNREQSHVHCATTLCSTIIRSMIERLYTILTVTLKIRKENAFFSIGWSETRQ